MTKTPDERPASEIIGIAANGATNREHDRHHNALERLDRIRHEALAALRQWDETGVLVTNDSLEEEYTHYFTGPKSKAAGLRAIVRAEASRQHRPILVMELVRPRYGASYIHLSIPAGKRFNCLAAPFLLLARECHDINEAAWATSNRREAVTRFNTPNTWHFYFVPPDTLELRENFIEMCRTDPVCRIVLKIPPVTSGGN